jgi:predicted ATP-binding protein involved in virulence
MQMILTTHSPQVLSTVDAESIRLIHLENGQGIIKIPKFQTRGVESADILSRLMNIHPVPRVEQALWLSQYRAMVQVGEFESEVARSLWSRLIDHFGAEHPVLVEIDTLRRLQEFKIANRISPTMGTDHA